MRLLSFLSKVFKKPDGSVRKASVAGGGIITAASVSMAVFLGIADIRTAPMTIQFEGMVLSNYWDAIGGVETWCVGETQVGRLPAGNYTKEYCTKLFIGSFGKYSRKLYDCYDDSMKPFVSPSMHGAFTDVYYNTGARCNTVMMRSLKAGTPVKACDGILEYKKAGGRDCSVRSNGCYGVWDRRVKLHKYCVDEARELEKQL